MITFSSNDNPNTQVQSKVHHVHALQESVGGAYLPFPGLEPVSGERLMSVTNLPRVAFDNDVAGIRTSDLLVASPAPYRYANKPHQISAANLVTDW